ncbi:glycosyltransferase family 2 protein [Nostoc sp.]|uniref:glycosyltransferase family 2 protein n=1 Tax=Nostoc sp. TaxID=1180 RepID=UPI002FF52562
MKFSLIVATKNRVNEVDRFLRSLVAQSYREFEVIIIDQNSDERLVNVVNCYHQEFTITHIQKASLGVSRVRNQGRLLAKGDIIAYPDDDCVYPPDVLAKVAHFFKSSLTWDGLTVRVMDLESDRDAFDYCLQKSGIVDCLTAWSLGIGPAMFFRAELAKKIAFDETLGPGSGTPWGCGEDTDYLLQCVENHAAVYYDFELFVRHPQPYAIYSLRQLAWREFTYGQGFGYLLKKRNISLPTVLYLFLEPMLLMAKYTMVGNFRYALPCPGMALGRVLGYWGGVRKFTKGKLHEFEILSN